MMLGSIVRRALRADRIQAAQIVGAFFILGFAVPASARETVFVCTGFSNKTIFLDFDSRTARDLDTRDPVMPTTITSEYVKWSDRTIRYAGGSLWYVLNRYTGVLTSPMDNGVREWACQRASDKPKIGPN
jgi:hypothetical protein